MKKYNLVLAACISVALSASSLASEPNWNTNPFIKDGNKQAQGLQVYSFSDNPNEFTESIETKDYVELSRETKEYGFAQVHPTQIRNFNNLVREYQDGNKEFKRTFKREIMMRQSKSDRTSLAMKFSGETLRLNNALLQGFKTIHKSFSGNFIQGKGWDQMSRIVKSQTLGTVIIDIMTLSQGRALFMDADAVNYYVNGNPGILYVLQDGNGRAETSLTWADNKRSYSIKLDKNINDPGLMEEFKKLTSSISDNYIPMKRKRIK